ncbi:hypothetical protein V6N11_067719 [Hibiscus sabdariffa]|uniref:Bet v I/Major latex protein domain-containing protein n=1 Tax=Hibiscus sabdariffa TaxID=183260 RepID=A0ABR2SRK6_9ROSI
MASSTLNGKVEADVKLNASPEQFHDMFATNCTTCTILAKTRFEDVIYMKSKGGGNMVHWKMEYEKLHDGIDHPETLLQLGLEVSKDIDAHLTQAK